MSIQNYRLTRPSPIPCAPQRSPEQKLAAVRGIRLEVVALAAVFLAAMVSAHAASHVWTGSGPGNLWSQAANWQDGMVPQAGESPNVLIFPAGSARLVSTNDLPGLMLDQLVLSGSGYVLAGTNALLLSSNAPISIQAVGATNRIALPLVLQGANGITVATNTAFALSGCLSGSGGISLSGGGLLTLAPVKSRDNTYTGPTRVLDGILQLESGFTTDPNFGSRTYSLAVPGFLIVGQTNINTPAIVRGMAMSTNTALTLLGSGQYQVVGDYLGFGSLNGDGLVDFQGQSFQVGNNNESTVFSGQLTNRFEAGLSKVGNGSLTLSGRALSDVGLVVSGGKLIVDGDFGLCNTVVSSDPLIGTSGFLEGNGRLGMTFAYGTLSPGHDGPGRLTCKSCDLSINSALIVEMAGTNSGIDFDQLVIEDNFGFETADPVLDVRMGAGFVGSVGNQYLIVRNDGTNHISGNFKGLPENASFNQANRAVFRITYQGGDGNDVVLTQLVAVPVLQTPRLTVDGQVLLSGTGSPGVSYVIEANTNLWDNAGWFPIGSVQADSLGLISFTDAPAIVNGSRYYRLHAP